MSEENVNVEPETQGTEKQRLDEVAAERIGKYKGVVDGWVDRCLGLVGDHPWEQWIEVVNGYVDKFLPFVVALAGVLSFLTGFITDIRCDARFSEVIGNLWILVGTVFAMHLAPKALALMRSFVEKGEVSAIRPELAYILKVTLGIGSLVFSVLAFFTFTLWGTIAGLVGIVVSVIASIVFTRPAFIGMKFDYPTNCVEETISLVLLPVKVVFTLLTPLIGLSVICGLIGGIVLWFDNAAEAGICLGATAVTPVLVPVGSYFSYLALVFMLDLYRAVSSVPRKIDELKKVVESK